ncbi:hypothetical protein [Dactylosporangium sp. CA-233914]|uniref:hypothetical protein n=1 Tax=Dactylosporangium sp. CA-233914 TaxID=3239934 RepID=UPI003D942E91
MTRRLRRALLAAVLGIAVGVAGTAVPAGAAPRPADAARLQAVGGFDWASLAVSVALTVLGGGSSGDIDAAVQRIIAAVEQSRTDILNHIDAIAAADVQACARQHTIEFADINNMSRTVEQLWAQDATRCATLATAYLNAVQSQAAADTIGLLIGEIYAIAMAARAKGGFGVNLLLQDEISSYHTVITKLEPSCVEHKISEYDSRGRVVTTEIQYTCTAYNGDIGYDSEDYYRGKRTSPPLDREAVKDTATRNTSRAVAKAALPGLEAVLP